MKWTLYLQIIGLYFLVNPASSVIADNKTRFAVIADMPYSVAQYNMLTAPDGEIAAAIRAMNPPVLIHLGDFKKSSTSCTDTLLQESYAQISALNPFRTVYTPGDNEWTDCDRIGLLTRFDELERLAFLRQLFFHQLENQLSRDIPDLVRQEDFIENALWKINDVVFATLHIPGTNNGREEILLSAVDQALNEADNRDRANMQWLRKLFQMAETAQAVVIAFHADIYHIKRYKSVCSSDNRKECDGYRLIREQIEKEAQQYKKPVLIIHGDTVAYCLHQPQQDIPNLWRLNAPGDYKHIDANQVIFDPELTDQPFQVTGLLDNKAPPSICNHSLLGF